jgi:hypothetical protein
MGGFGKLHETIFNSTIIEDTMIPESPIPFSAYIFMCLLALCDAEGVIDITWDALSRRLNCSMGDLKVAIYRLMQPDPSSRSSENEGRRLISLSPDRDWGWIIVNYKKYRQMRSTEDRREYQKNLMRKIRAENKNLEGFDQWWKLYPARTVDGKVVKAGKQNATILFTKVIQSEEDFQSLLKATERYSSVIGKWAKDPERFLKDEYWRDFIPEVKGREEKGEPVRIQDKEGKVFEMIQGEWREVIE